MEERNESQYSGGGKLVLKREILFRGLRKDGKGWIYGDLAQWKEKGLCAILPQQGNEWSNPYDFDVIPETVGQFTGLIDKNGNKIFEGDRMTAEYCGSSSGVYISSVSWEDGACGWFFANAPLWTWENIEVTGNIHEK